MYTTAKLGSIQNLLVYIYNMNAEKKYLATIYLQNKFYKSNDTSFQTLFEQIMGYYDPDFMPVKPDGNKGDGGFQKIESTF